MEGNSIVTPLEYQDETAPYGTKDAQREVLSLAHLQKLVHLLDHSDISEIELNRVEEGFHLVLRRTGPSAEPVHQLQAVETHNSVDATDQVAIPTLHNLNASLVGVFHPWLKPQGKNLVEVGMRVNAGQIVGSIEALNIFHEVVAAVSGPIVEIAVQDGQLVEYGQLLMTIGSSEEAKV